jgi:hypothetical protein
MRQNRDTVRILWTNISRIWDRKFCLQRIHISRTEHDLDQRWEINKTNLNIIYLASQKLRHCRISIILVIQPSRPNDEYKLWRNEIILSVQRWYVRKIYKCYIRYTLDLLMVTSIKCTEIPNSDTSQKPRRCDVKPNLYLIVSTTLWQRIETRALNCTQLMTADQLMESVVDHISPRERLQVFDSGHTGPWNGLKLRGKIKISTHNRNTT